MQSLPYVCDVHLYTVLALSYVLRCIATCAALPQVEDAVQAIASGKSLKTVLTQQGTPSVTLDMSIAEAQLSADAAAAAAEASFEVLELVKNRGMKKVMHT
jgi:hypothetical protein